MSIGYPTRAHISGSHLREETLAEVDLRWDTVDIISALFNQLESSLNVGAVTSRKLGFGHRAIFTLVPVQSRTGTNVSIGPGSCGQGPAGPRGGIGPGSSGPFGPGWWDKPGPMGHAPGPPPFSPGSYHKPGLKGWS